MGKYKHVFFDLDRTLWDFDKNSSDTLRDIYKKFSLNNNIDSPEEFIETYNYNNDNLWDDLKKGLIQKSILRTERFRLTLEKYGITDAQMVARVNQDYLDYCPVKSELIPGAQKLLDYLHKKYRLYIISNGFYDIQLAKLKCSGIAWYFTRIYTSDIIGSAKPDKQIYDYAISSSNARKAESIMIGDDFRNDIFGAQQAGIDQIYFNQRRIEPFGECTHVVDSLQEIMEII